MEFWGRGSGGNIHICIVACVIFSVFMAVYGAMKERMFVSICSAVYLSNFVAFVESGDIMLSTTPCNEPVLNLSGNLRLACSLRVSSDLRPNPFKSCVTLC
jgi:hypothetical protein